MAKGIVTAEEKQRAMVETVRGAVFPESSDAEMALFLTKCKLTGIDPLSKKIIPIAFNTKKGRNVSFITTIDLLRSKANETGKYEGMDETEFGELMDFEYTDYDGNKQTIEVPEYAKVQVWKSGIPRPFIGIARWREYYPGDQKGGMWRQRPHGQLEKCAEALALRRAFPDEIDKLYTDEEMQATVELLALGDNTTGSRLKPGHVSMPTSKSKKSGPINPPKSSRTKTITEKQVKLIFGKAHENNVDMKNVKAWLGRHGIDDYNDIPSGKFFNSLIKTIEVQPEFFSKNKSEPSVGNNFIDQVNTYRSDIGVDDDGWENFCDQNGWPADPAEITDPDVQQAMIERLQEWAAFAEEM